jgi:hypothetical protein
VRHSTSIRWAWALNAAASVLGSALAITFAIYFGLRETLLIGGLCYLGALFAAWASRATAAPPLGATEPLNEPAPRVG